MLVKRRVKRSALRLRLTGSVVQPLVPVTLLLDLKTKSSGDSNGGLPKLSWTVLLFISARGRIRPLPSGVAYASGGCPVLGGRLKKAAIA